MSSRRGASTTVAKSIPFNSSGSSLTAKNAEDAIKELNTTVVTSASPGFGFGKGGNVTANSYLLCESVPSNVSGRYIYINNAVITRVFISTQNASTFDIEVFHHDGNEVNLTSLGTVSVVASTGGEFQVSWPVPSQKQIAMRIINGSAKNVVGGLELQGTNV